MTRRWKTFNVYAVLAISSFVIGSHASALTRAGEPITAALLLLSNLALAITIGILSREPS